MSKQQIAEPQTPPAAAPAKAEQSAQPDAGQVAAASLAGLKASVRTSIAKALGISPASLTFEGGAVSAVATGCAVTGPWTQEAAQHVVTWAAQGGRLGAIPAEGRRIVSYAIVGGPDYAPGKALHVVSAVTQSGARGDGSRRTEPAILAVWIGPAAPTQQ